MLYNTIKEYAQAYSKLNLYTFPCHGIYKESNKCTCGRKTCKEKDAGKHPKNENGWKGATLDTDKYRYPNDARDNQLTNIALATGSQSGELVIDIDDPKQLELLESKYGPLPRTWLAKSGRNEGGYHYYFEWRDDFANVKNTKLIGYKDIDIRADGGYIMLPPSRHRSGNEYQWINDPETTPLAPAPAWLIALLPRDDAKTSVKATPSPTLPAKRGATQPTIVDDTNVLTIIDPDAARVSAYLATVPPAISGQGGMNSTFQLVCKLRECFGHFRTDEQLFDDLQTWNASCDPPWTDKELRRKITDARKKTGIVCNEGNPSDLVANNADHEQPPTITTPASLPWPMLNDHALYGLAGDIVRRIEPQSETDPVALLTTLLTSFGVAVGRNPHYIVEGTKHHANVYSCLVGRSSRARKGTSLGRIKDVLRDAIPPTISGLSTGEGLIHEVRDASTKQARDGSFETIQGVDDKRLWIIESELARTLNVMRREGNILSSILRDAWDDGELRVSTRANPLTATDAHIGMTTHITLDELSKTMSDQETYNGFANRFLFAVVKRSKLLPDGGDDIELEDLRKRIAIAIDQAKKIGRMTRSKDCTNLWRKAYPFLVEEKTGTYDAITSRAEAITLRLSMLYALLDASTIIEADHLKAALALWTFCDHSAEYLFSSPDKRTIVGETNRQAILALINDKSNMTTPASSTTMAEPLTRGEAASVSGNASDSEPLTQATPQVSEPTSTSNVESVTIKAATLPELFDFRNAHEGSFERRADGVIELVVLDTPDIPLAIKQAVIENQTILVALATDSTSEQPPSVQPINEPLELTLHADESSDLASDPFIVAMREAETRERPSDPREWTDAEYATYEREMQVNPDMFTLMMAELD